MSPALILSLIAGYFTLLLLISYRTSRNSDNATFFLGNRKSPWFLVAFGMIGASLSGATFISVPGWVASQSWHYYQIVLGYIGGYFIIAHVLMPIYYRLRLTSIYGYLQDRLGFWSYKTGAAFFLLSRTAGASCRLFLVAMVLHLFIFQQWNVPFAITVLTTIVLIWIYTFRGGIKTIVWTDTLQTAFMLIAMILTIVLIGKELGWGFGEMVNQVASSSMSNIFDWDPNSSTFFPKALLAGVFIAATMTGLDQDMMQKNLSCRNLKEGQRNIHWQAILFPLVNVFFLSLGVLLYLFASIKYQAIAGAPAPDVSTQMNALGDAVGVQYGGSDDLFPLLALQYLSPVVGAFFVIGLIAAAYSSADSALTSLTTSFCVDFLGMTEQGNRKMTRYTVHVAVSLVLLGMILVLKAADNRTVIDLIFKFASYTYGPLLGLFSFGIFTNRRVTDKFVPIICLLAPTLCYFLQTYSPDILGGYQIGYELLVINGLLTFFGLLIVSKPGRLLPSGSDDSTL